MDKIKIFTNQEEIEHIKSAFENEKHFFDEALKSLSEAGITVISTDELLEAVLNSRDFIISKIEGKIPDEDLPKVGGFKVNKAEFIRMLELPNFDPIIDGLKLLYHKINVLAISEIKQNQLIVSKKKLTDYENGVSIFAETPEEIEIVQLAQPMVEAAQKLYDYLKKNEYDLACFNTDNLVGRLLYLNKNEGTIYVSPFLIGKKVRI